MRASSCPSIRNVRPNSTPTPPLSKTEIGSPSTRVGEPAKYKVEKWDLQGAHVEEVVASASLIMIGHAAFHAAVEQYPGASLTLRQGTRVILKSPE